MLKFLVNLLVVLIAITLLGSISSGNDLPLGRPDTDLYYSTLRELYLRGLADSPKILFSPVSNKYIKELSRENYQGHIAKVSASLKLVNSRFYNSSDGFNFSVPAITYGSANNSEKNAYLALFPSMNYRMSNTILLELVYRLDSGLNDDSLYTGKIWNGFAGYAQSANLKYQGKKLSIDVGRRKSRWGIAGDGNTLLLSKPARPLDGLFIDYKINRLISFHFINAYLSRIYSDASQENSGSIVNRYLSSHALRISPSIWLDLVFKESVIYGGPGRRLEFNYAIPFLWFHGEQLNEDFDDNTFLGMEAVIRLRNKYAGYFELLVDDFQIEKNTLSDNEPNEVGYIAGINIFDFPVNASRLEIEYSRISNFTYNQIRSYNRYTNYNMPIGHPLGPDHESFAVSYMYHIKKNITTELEFYIKRRGEGRINDPWETPWINDPAYANKFPSGIVEKTHGGTFGLSFQKSDILQGEFSLSYKSIKNYRNIAGIDKNLWGVDFRVIVTALSFQRGH